MTKKLKNLKRTENKKWMFTSENDLEVVLKAPHFKAAQLAAFAIDKKPLPLKFKASDSSKTTYWKLKKQKRAAFFILSNIPFFKKYPNLSITYYQIRQSKFLFYKKSYQTTLKISPSLFSLPVLVYPLDRHFSDKLEENPFADPFTQIASAYFQKISPYFTYSKSPVNPHVIVYEDQTLKLQKSYLKTSKMHAQTWQAFYNHLIEVFGKQKVEVISYRFNIHIEQKIEDQTPLFPEYVYRFNLGLNNIEMEDVELLFSKLSRLYQDIKNEDTTPVFFDLFKKYGFTLRELRQLRSQTKQRTLKEFLDLIFSSLQKSTPVRDLPPRSFHLVVKLLMTPSSYFDEIFTGKKIAHKAISSYYTVGSKRHFKPWIDQQELLQVFGNLKKAKDWKSYYELLTHVVVKKHLIRKHPQKKWSLGALIPAPLNEAKEERWYFVEYWTEDNLGDFNYVLTPCSTKEETLPVIKLYRSTASNAYNMFGWNSITSDLSLGTAPGKTNRYAVDDYEFPLIRKHTLAVWVAYIYLASKETHFTTPYFNEVSSQNFLLKQAYIESPKEIQDLFSFYEQNVLSAKALIPRLLYQSLLDKFITLAKSKKEWVDQKSARNLAFVGHSLGGAFAQGALDHFIARYKRLPLKNCKCICYTSNAPAISRQEVEHFWSFLERHQFLIGHLNSKWDLISQFEYGDLVMQSGTLHLGAIRNFTCETLIDIDQSLFKPLKQATALTINTLPTHGRRIGGAKVNQDYDLSLLSPLELHRFNQAVTLNPSQRQVFGFFYFRSPRLFEKTRRTLALSTFPLRATIKKIWQTIKKPRGSELRDSNGFAHLHYFPSKYDLQKTSNLKDVSKHF